jgi:regulator of replication initiation timing
MKKNEKFIARELLDNINGKTYYFRIYYTSHEIDGNLIAKNDIDLKEGLQDIIYYPNLESAKKEEEHKKIEESNKIEEKPSKMEGLTKIKKGSKILIEVKQNTTLEILFGQMETFLKDYSILFPNEQYYYLGFVNSVKAKNIPNEEKFVERIKECEKVNPNFKIFLFTIKDNILFDLELADKANYSLYFRNEVKREIKELKDKVDTLTTEMGSMKTEMGSMKTEMGSMKTEMGSIKTEMGSMKTEMGSMKTEMGSMKTEMGSMKTEMGSMKTEISKLRKDVDSLKDDNKSLRKEMKDQFESLKNMIMDLMNKKSENDDKNN